MQKHLIRNVSVAVELEGYLFRAFAFVEETGEHIAQCKCIRKAGAISGLMDELKKLALEKAKE